MQEIVMWYSFFQSQFQLTTWWLKLLNSYLIYLFKCVGEHFVLNLSDNGSTEGCLYGKQNSREFAARCPHCPRSGTITWSSAYHKLIWNNFTITFGRILIGNRENTSWLNPFLNQHRFWRQLSMLSSLDIILQTQMTWRNVMQAIKLQKYKLTWFAYWDRKSVV